MDTSDRYNECEHCGAMYDFTEDHDCNPKPLTFAELREANAARGIEWVGDHPIETKEELLFRAVELGGEAGEALDAVKKLVRHLNKWKGGVDRQQSEKDIADELADVVICADRVAEAMRIDLGKAVTDKFNRTSEKHGLLTVLN